jgi:hypothetical protein
MPLGGFAWAANPEKTDVARLRPIQASLAVRPEDLPPLRKLLDAPECARATLDVIVVGEWKSGAQDVVTAPKPGCAPVRLRLAHGRLSAAD